MVNDLFKTKSSGISAVLGNDKLAKSIKEALDSPFGSTKRKKASSILRAVNVGQNDGMGGGLEENATFAEEPITGMTRTSTPPTIGIPKGPAVPITTPRATSNGQIGIGQQGQTGLGKAEDGAPIEGTAPNMQIFPSAPGLKTGVSVFPDFSQEWDPNIGIGKSTGNFGIGEAGEGAAITQVPQTSEEVASFIDTVDEDYIKTWYQGLSEADQKRWQPLYEASEAGVGAKTFAWSIMQDTAALKQLFPNIPEEALPQGASLVGQLEEVENTLRDEFDIDKLKGNLDRQIETGVTIEDDLTDYITARDTYIERLDDMIGNAKDSVLTMDMANPYVAKKMNGYLNYLYIMKGRQQKTYTDFLNSGINQYNQQTKVAQDLYSNAYDRFERSLKNKTAVTREEHDVMTTMLEEMYTNIEGREKSQLEMAKLREEVIQEQYQTAVDAVDSLSGGNAIKMTTTQKVKSQSNFLQDNPEMNLTDWSKLSGEEQLSYIEGEDSSDSAAVNSLVMEIIKSKQSFDKKGAEEVPSIYYNDEKEVINWDKIPVAQRDAVRAKYEAVIRASMKAKLEKAGTEEEKKSILDRIRGLVGGTGKGEVPQNIGLGNNIGIR